MKKIFTLIALAAFAFNMNAGTPKTADPSDDMAYTMSILDASNKSAVKIEVGYVGVPEKPTIPLVQFELHAPDGAVGFVYDEELSDPDAEEYAYVVAEGYEEGWGLKKFSGSNSEVKSSDPGEGAPQKLLKVILNHPTKTGSFAAGEHKICYVTLNAEGLERGNGDGKNKARFYVTIPGNDETKVIFSARTDDDGIDWTFVPLTQVELMIGVAEDGSITGIESVRTNSEAKKGIYNLMGQKVNEMQAGQIYIVDGKKVMK